MDQMCLLSEDNYYAYLDFAVKTEDEDLKEQYKRQMEWLYEANGTSPRSDSADNVISLAQIAAIPQSNSNGDEAYGYAASFTIGAAAATAYLYYANKQQRKIMFD